MSGPRVEITYCTKCRFLLRAAWMAEELLTTFGAELGEVVLRPGSGGIFEVVLDGAAHSVDISLFDPGRFAAGKPLRGDHPYGDLWR